MNDYERAMMALQLAQMTLLIFIATMSVFRK